MQSLSRPGRIAGLALASVSAATLVLLGWVGAEGAALPPCGLKMVTGLPCPLCGGVRATAALGRGALEEALWWNPAAVAIHAGLLVSGALIAFAKTPPWLRAGRSPNVFRIAMVLLAVNWVYLIAAGR